MSGDESKEPIADTPAAPEPKPPAEGVTLPVTGPTVPVEESARPVIPGYHILGEVGRGGMGVVYQARQEDLDRLVAVKVILAGAHAGTEALARFRAEARVIARLNHPHIVQIHQVGEHGGVPFLALELVEGGSLAAALDGNPWPAARAAELVEKLARAMHAVHAKGIIHRDLKPGNVLLAANGEPKITDFGLAKQLESGATGPTATNAAIGTPAYMAPEQTGGRHREIGPGTDVYALGAHSECRTPRRPKASRTQPWWAAACDDELLTGRPPFVAETLLDTMLLVVSAAPTPPRRLSPSVPSELELICLKCLAKRIDERYPTAADLADELARFRAGEPVAVRPPGLRRRFAHWRMKHPAKAAALAIAAVLWLAGLLLFGRIGNFLTFPAFGWVMLVFVRPGRRTFALGAVLAAAYLLTWAVVGDPIRPAILLGVGLVAGLLVGVPGRVVARLMKREVLGTTLGAYFGGLAGTLCGCCGSPLIFALALGQENVEKLQRMNQNVKQISEAEMWALWEQMNFTWALGLVAGWLLFCALLAPTVGAFLGAAVTSRRGDDTSG
jgi:hypothetical protein